MKLLTQAELKELSFPDSKVECMEINNQDKTARIELNSAYLSCKGGVRLPACDVQIKQWHSLSAKLYKASMERWETLEEDCIESLTDICEFEYGDDVVFRGFGEESGQWIEIVFSKPVFEVSVAD
jgi:hypothetical protein